MLYLNLRLKQYKRLLAISHKAISIYNFLAISNQLKLKKRKQNEETK